MCFCEGIRTRDLKTDQMGQQKEVGQQNKFKLHSLSSLTQLLTSVAILAIANQRARQLRFPLAGQDEGTGAGCALSGKEGWMCLRVHLPQTTLISRHEKPGGGERS